MAALMLIHCGPFRKALIAIFQSCVFTCLVYLIFVSGGAVSPVLCLILAQAGVRLCTPFPSKREAKLVLGVAFVVKTSVASRGVRGSASFFMVHVTC